MRGAWCRRRVVYTDLRGNTTINIPDFIPYYREKLVLPVWLVGGGINNLCKYRPVYCFNFY